MAKVRVIKVTRTPKNKEPKWVRNVYIDVSKIEKEKEEKNKNKNTNKNTNNNIKKK